MNESTWTPPEPCIRERYRSAAAAVENGPGIWNSTLVSVWRGEEKVAEYLRNYGMLRTFEPFQQWDGERWHEYALISHEYTRSSVLDLESGEIVADEEPTYYDRERTRGGAGFCPVEFYVPNWWDLHDGSILPGSKHWKEESALPDGTLGFVAGCHWGDDSSWKLQVLDLTMVKDGQIRRDDRFGYVELPPGVALRDAVRYHPESRSVEIATALSFDVESGALEEWSLRGLTDPGMRNHRREGEG